MCQAFSCIVGRDGKVYWKAGLDSHDGIKECFKLPDNIAHRDLKDYARVELTPSKGYLYPNSKWVFQLDEFNHPRWWDATYERKARKALSLWKKEVYGLLDLEQARHPLNPLTGQPHQPTEVDIESLKKWASVWASVEASVWASVWAYCGSVFSLPQWKDAYPYQSAVDLWKRGFVASYDGKEWRLHSGEKAKVVYTWNKERNNG